MRLKWKEVSPVITSETRRKFMTRDIGSNAFLEALIGLDTFPRSATLAFIPKEPREVSQDFTVYTWNSRTSTFDLARRSIRRGDTEQKRREIRQQFDIEEKIGREGEGLKAFFERQLPRLLEDYDLSFARLEFKDGGFFTRPDASVRFSIFPHEAMRVEMGIESKHKAQLEAWFHRIPHPTNQIGYV